MWSSTILFSLLAIGLPLAQGDACLASGYLDCVNAPLSTSCTVPASAAACACSQMNAQTACLASFCPGSTLDPEQLTPLQNLGCITAAPTSTGAGTVTTTGTGATPTAGAVTATTNSKGDANMAIVPAGGFLAVVLGILAYL